MQQQPYEQQLNEQPYQPAYDYQAQQRAYAINHQNSYQQRQAREQDPNNDQEANDQRAKYTVAESIVNTVMHLIIFSLIFYATFGLFFYFYSTNPIYYNGDSCLKIRPWAFIYSLLCFANIAVRIFVQIPILCKPSLKNGVLGDFNAIYQSIEAISSTILLFGLTILLSGSKACGDLHSLVFLWVILMWVIIPIFFCSYCCCKGFFLTKTLNDRQQQR